MRFALLLFGRVGLETRRSADMSLNAPSSVRFWEKAAGTIRARVVEALRRDGWIVDVFVQSWNLDLATRMDDFWRPRASHHANQSMGTAECTLQYARRAQYCDRTLWAMRGMVRAAALRRSWAARSGHDHALMLTMRHDLYWSADFRPAPLNTSYPLALPASFVKEEDGALYALPTDRTLLNHQCSEPYWCNSTVTVDWWWLALPSFADDIAHTIHRFDMYAYRITTVLKKRQLTPHHMWGLYFYHFAAARIPVCKTVLLGHAGNALLARLPRRACASTPMRPLYRDCARVQAYSAQSVDRRTHIGRCQR